MRKPLGKQPIPHEHASHWAGQPSECTEATLVVFRSLSICMGQVWHYWTLCTVFCAWKSQNNLPQVWGKCCVQLVFPGGICIGNVVWNPVCFSQSVYPSVYEKVATGFVSYRGGIWYFILYFFKTAFSFFFFSFLFSFSNFSLKLFYLNFYFLYFFHCILSLKLHSILGISDCFPYLGDSTLL